MICCQTSASGPILHAAVATATLPSQAAPGEPARLLRQECIRHCKALAHDEQRMVSVAGEARSPLASLRVPAHTNGITSQLAQVMGDAFMLAWHDAETSSVASWERGVSGFHQLRQPDMATHIGVNVGSPAHPQNNQASIWGSGALGPVFCQARYG